MHAQPLSASPALDVRFPASPPDPELPDRLAALLDDHHPVAIDEGTVEPHGVDAPPTCWRVHFAAGSARDRAAAAVADAFGTTGLTVSVVEVRGENWALRSQATVRAIQVGGPLGAYLPESQWDTPLDYEAFAEAGAMLGHGGVVVFDDTVDMSAQARFAMEFCAEESCGKCTPCRIGSTRGVEVIDRIIARESIEANRALLDELCDTMEHASLCAMGGLTPNPVRSALAHFPEDFQ